jgi:hypothetical protein
MTSKMRTMVTACGLATVAVCAGLGAAPAAAAKPDVFVLQLDETGWSRTSEDCGFDILVHVQGTIRFVDFVDGDGDLVRSLVTYPSLTYTFSNAETGTSVSSRSPDPEHYTWNADGSFTVQVTGLVMHFAIPGQGTVGQAGRFVVTIDPEGGETGSEPVGLDEDYHAALCQILAL